MPKFKNEKIIYSVGMRTSTDVNTGTVIGSGPITYGTVQRIDRSGYITFEITNRSGVSFSIDGDSIEPLILALQQARTATF